MNRTFHTAAIATLLASAACATTGITRPMCGPNEFYDCVESTDPTARLLQERLERLQEAQVAVDTRAAELRAATAFHVIAGTLMIMRAVAPPPAPAPVRTVCNTDVFHNLVCETR